MSKSGFIIQPLLSKTVFEKALFPSVKQLLVSSPMAVGDGMQVCRGIGQMKRRRKGQVKIIKDNNTWREEHRGRTGMLERP